MSEFRYLGRALDESGTNVAESCMKETCGRKVAAAIRSLFNARSLQLECTRVLHVSFLLYCSEERRGLRLGVGRWTTSEVCWVLGEEIKCQVHRLEICGE